jgi:hypothetical protein
MLFVDTLSLENREVFKVRVWTKEKGRNGHRIFSAIESIPLFT